MCIQKVLVERHRDDLFKPVWCHPISLWCLFSASSEMKICFVEGPASRHHLFRNMPASNETPLSSQSKFLVVLGGTTCHFLLNFNWRAPAHGLTGTSPSTGLSFHVPGRLARTSPRTGFSVQVPGQDVCFVRVTGQTLLHGS